MLQNRLKLFVNAGGSLVQLVTDTKIPMPGIKALENGDESMLTEEDNAALDKFLPPAPVAADEEKPLAAAASSSSQQPAAASPSPQNGVQSHANPNIPNKSQLMRITARRLFARNWGNKNVKFTWTHNDSQLQLVLKTGLVTLSPEGKDEKFQIKENARLEVWEMMSGRRVKEWTAEFAWNAPADKVLTEIAQRIDEFCPSIIFRPKCPRCKVKKHLSLAIRQHNEDNQYWLCSECGFWENLNGGTTKMKSERKMKELEATGNGKGKLSPPPAAVPVSGQNSLSV